MQNRNVKRLPLAVLVAALALASVAHAAPVQTISLSTGWNFISFPKQPPNTLISTVLSGVSANVAIVWGYNNQNKAWKKYIPGGTSNSLSTMEANKGYWIYMTATGTIDMTGWAPAIASVPLYEGWNLVGYSGEDIEDVTTTLASISNQWVLVWNWTDGTWFGKHQTLTTLPAPIQPLTGFAQGKAYWVKIGGPQADWDQPGDGGNYFPGTVGNSWSFRVTASETGQPDATYNDTFTITGTKETNGVQTGVFTESNPSNSGAASEDYRSKNAAGVTYYGNNDASDMLTRQLVPYDEARFPLKPGASFVQMNKAGLDFGQDLDGDGITERVAVYSQVTVVGFESVTVDAGTFHNCAKLQTTLTETVTSSYYNIRVTVTGTVTEWDAPGVGPVKTQSVISLPGYSSSTKTYTLVTFNVDGRRDGPQVISVQPINTVAPGSDYTITAAFNREMDPSSVNEGTFVVRDSENNPIQGTVSWVPSYPQYESAKFTPSMPLIPGTYTATISTGAKDNAGNPLLSPYSWTFTIENTLFLRYLSLPTGSWPRAVAIGDVNGDGRNDVVMVTGFYFSPDDYKLFVFLQNAAGALEPPIKYPTGDVYPGYGYVAIGDVNHDGRNDVVVGNAAGLEVFLQNASGGLDPRITHPTTTDTGMVKIVDVNDDGLLDIVGSGQATISICFQAPNGMLDPPITYTVGGYPADLDVADLNNDGLLDIVVRNAPRIGVLTQKPDGTFNVPVFYDIPKNWDIYGYIAAGDVNGDGLNDVVALYDEYPPKLGVFLQNATGGLNGAVSHPLTWSAQPVKIADLNNDGRNDVALLHGGCSLGVFLQAADGTLGTEAMYNCTGGSSWDYSQALAIGDINGDGLKDIVAASLGGVWVFYHTPP